MLISLENLVNKYALNIKGVIHIGAHYGEEVPHYYNMGIKNIILFEPLKDNFDEMIRRIELYLPFVTPFSFALGNENKTIEMFVETKNNGQSSSILKPEKHLDYYPHITFDKKEKVTMMRLDDFEINVNNFNFINIDVQGYELEVFKGAELILNHIDYVYAEVNREELYKDCARVEQIDEFLGKYGFTRVETFWTDYNWADALYIKK